MAKDGSLIHKKIEVKPKIDLVTEYSKAKRREGRVAKRAVRKAEHEEKKENVDVEREERGLHK